MNTCPPATSPSSSPRLASLRGGPGAPKGTLSSPSLGKSAMFRRTSLSGEPKRYSASSLASCVLPTPVGPAKRNTPRGARVVEARLEQRERSTGLHRVRLAEQPPHEELRLPPRSSAIGWSRTKRGSPVAAANPPITSSVFHLVGAALLGAASRCCSAGSRTTFPGDAKPGKSWRARSCASRNVSSAAISPVCSRARLVRRTSPPSSGRGAASAAPRTGRRLAGAAAARRSARRALAHRPGVIRFDLDRRQQHVGGAARLTRPLAGPDGSLERREVPAGSRDRRCVPRCPL